MPHKSSCVSLWGHGCPSAPPHVGSPLPFLPPVPLGPHLTQVTAGPAPTLYPAHGSNTTSPGRPSQTLHLHHKALHPFSLVYIVSRIWYHIVYLFPCCLSPPLGCRCYKGRTLGCSLLYNPGMYQWLRACLLNDYWMRAMILHIFIQEIPGRRQAGDRDLF